jgi:hypothetical protein
MAVAPATRARRITPAPMRCASRPGCGPLTCARRRGGGRRGGRGGGTRRPLISGAAGRAASAASSARPWMSRATALVEDGPARDLARCGRGSGHGTHSRSSGSTVGQGSDAGPDKPTAGTVSGSGYPRDLDRRALTARPINCRI